MRIIAGFIAVAFLAVNAHTSEIRVGMIGLDTSHATAFTALLNDSSHKSHVPGARVVAAFKGGSPDIESSATLAKLCLPRSLTRTSVRPAERRIVSQA